MRYSDRDRGNFRSISARVGARVVSSAGRDAAVEKWLREKVLGVYDAMRLDPGRTISAEKVFAAIHTRHADRLKKGREG